MDTSTVEQTSADEYLEEKEEEAQLVGLIKEAVEANLDNWLKQLGLQESDDAAKNYLLKRLSENENVLKELKETLAEDFNIVSVMDALQSIVERDKDILLAEIKKYREIKDDVSI